MRQSSGSQAAPSGTATAAEVTATLAGGEAGSSRTARSRAVVTPARPGAATSGGGPEAGAEPGIRPDARTGFPTAGLRAESGPDAGSRAADLEPGTGSETAAVGSVVAQPLTPNHPSSQGS